MSDVAPHVTEAIQQALDAAQLRAGGSIGTTALTIEHELTAVEDADDGD